MQGLSAESKRRSSPPPPRATREEEEQKFRRSLKISFIVHCALFVSAFLSYVVFPSKPVVYRPSVRVDLVGLPDLKKTDNSKANVAEMERLQKILKEVETEKKAPKTAPVKEPPKPVEADPADMALKNKKKEAEKPAPKDRKKDLNAAIARLKALEAMEESVKKESAPAKGNRLSKGSQLFGEETDDYNAYVDGLVGKVRNNWHLPLWLAKQKLSARVILYISANGQVDRVVFAQSSGNEQFDRYVERAIRASAPFDAPPSDIESDGISLGFPL